VPVPEWQALGVGGAAGWQARKLTLRLKVVAGTLKMMLGGSMLKGVQVGDSNVANSEADCGAGG